MVVENLHSCQDVMIVCQRAKAEVAPYFVGSYHQEMAKVIDNYPRLQHDTLFHR